MSFTQKTINMLSQSKIIVQIGDTN